MSDEKVDLDRDFLRAMEDAIVYGYGFIAITRDHTVGYLPANHVIAWAKEVDQYIVELED